MALIELSIHPREQKGKNPNRRTRVAGRIPGVIYGSGRATECIEVDALEFHKVMSTAGGGTAILSLGGAAAGEEGPIAIVREVQRHPVNDEILHFDLFEIPRGVPVEVPVRIDVVGESAAVRRGEANVNVVLDTVDVSCLPREMPDSIEVDISGLDVGDRILVRDLHTEAGRIMEEADALVLQLKAPTIFVEEEAAEEGEGAEGAEGAEAAEGEEGEAAAAPAKGKEEE